MARPLRVLPLLAVLLLGAPAPPTTVAPAPAARTSEPVIWHPSIAVGRPWHGRLFDGVLLPEQGRDYFTFDPVRRRAPNREWRRWGTDHLVRTLLRVTARYRAEHPDAPRAGVGDLSRPHGGPFGERYGGLGHASHQNGLDVDVYYPRLDRAELRPYKPALVDRELAQALVDAFVADGAQKVFVGPRLGLRGPRRIVMPLAHHDDHLHVRIPPR